MTEHAVVSGVMHHIDACRKVGIMPIVGVEAYYRPTRLVGAHYGRNSLEHTSETWGYYHMLLLAKDVRGWRSLKLLTSAAFRDGFYRKPCIDDELLDRYNEGLIISTSCVSGYIPRAILRGDGEAVDQHVAKLNRWAGDDWYFELQPHAFEDLVIVNREVAGLAQAHGRPLVTARDAHAPDETWISTQHVSIAIRRKPSKEKKADAEEPNYLLAADTAYIASADQTREDFRQNHPLLDVRVIDEAIANTGWVANRCVPWLMDRTPKLPRYRESADGSYRELRSLAYAGLERLGHADDQRYVDAIEKELAIYRDRSVCDFFLIVGDLVRWMKSTDGLPPVDYDPRPSASKQPQKVGLGRGSAGGCCVAYGLGITLINPINYELRFERFLNPHREGLPDIDLDFAPAGAELAKEYLKRRYGPDKVYDLISHSTMAARGALSSVAMAYEIPHAQRVALTKKIPEDESNVKLEDLRRHIPELERFAEDHPDVFKHAARLQGSVGALSEHAAGVVISGQPLDELMPVMRKAAKDDHMVTAFGETADKPTISKLGFLKIDLLVVVELAKQAYAEELVLRVHGVELGLDSLPALEDPRDVDRKVLDIFCTGAIRGIFQWDGRSNMASLTKRLQPEHVHHLAGANAVVRPGVSVHAESYVQRRHGLQFEYWDPSVEPALRETYGLPIFQEQIMSVFELLGGFSAAEADDVRRIMSKDYRSKDGKAQRNLALHRERFVVEATSICGQAMAAQIWDYCGHAAEYCFNRIHAEEYALMAVQGAHIKANYPDAFYASLLTFPPAWVKKPENRSEFYERIVREARAFGIDVKPPDVNESDDGFTIHGDSVRFGMKGIKGLGPAMVADVLNNRPFTSLEDMGVRLTACNAAGRHALAQAGALDRFGARANLTAEERATFEEDRIGVALSSEDKLAPVREGIRKMIHTADEVEAAAHGAALVVGGEVISGREVETSSKHGPACKLLVAFGADEYNVSLPPWIYKEALVKELLASDAPVIVRGHRDVEWDCVAVETADAFRAADEVLEMMSSEREKVAA